MTETSTEASTALEHPAAGREERTTRKKLAASGTGSSSSCCWPCLWGFLLWAKLDEVPIMSVAGRGARHARAKWWILALAGARDPPPGPLPHQRALGRLPPVLDRAGLRRRRAAHRAR